MIHFPLHQPYLIPSHFHPNHTYSQTHTSSHPIIYKTTHWISSHSYCLDIPKSLVLIMAFSSSLKNNLVQIYPNCSLYGLYYILIIHINIVCIRSYNYLCSKIILRLFWMELTDLSFLERYSLLMRSRSIWKLWRHIICLYISLYFTCSRRSKDSLNF